MKAKIVEKLKNILSRQNFEYNRIKRNKFTAHLSELNFRFWKQRALYNVFKILDPYLSALLR